jgi:Domain of unknown function (DUF1330)
MPAYVIYIREETHDQLELDTYSALVGPILAKLPVKILAALGKLETLEGPVPEERHRRRICIDGGGIRLVPESGISGGRAASIQRCNVPRSHRRGHIAGIRWRCWLTKGQRAALGLAATLWRRIRTPTGYMRVA